ncbi:MAG TPA: cupin domain-containing protein [Bacillota bacterium]
MGRDSARAFARERGALIHTEELPWQEVSDKVPGVIRRALADADENPARLRVYLARIRPGGYFPEHFHPYPQVFVFISGQGRVWLDGRPVAVGPGDVVRMFRGERHRVENAGDEDLVLYEISVVDTALKVHRR